MNYTRYLLLLFGVMALASCRQEKLDVTFSSLLEEMVDYEEAARFPALPFSCRQESSYDRRSIHPDSAGWFANNDGFGIIRVDTVNGRKENVLFDQDGPGVITRFWLTTMDKRGVMRFTLIMLKMPNGKSRHMTCFAQDCRSVENLPKNTPTILRMEREEIPCFYRSRTATDVKSPLNCRIQSNRPPNIME